MAPLTALTALGTGARPLASSLAVRCVHVAWPGKMVMSWDFMALSIVSKPINDSPKQATMNHELHRFPNSTWKPQGCLLNSCSFGAPCYFSASKWLWGCQWTHLIIFLTIPKMIITDNQSQEFREQHSSMCIIINDCQSPLLVWDHDYWSINHKSFMMIKNPRLIIIYADNNFEITGTHCSHLNHGWDSG